MQALRNRREAPALLYLVILSILFEFVILVGQFIARLHDLLMD